ncbi:hypothetical protein M011DRAFT_500311 [Sporormia fimetaria CBS 119925]|uniref:Uncharacterized protein n=1 Tax=Sporormia fimetaria CBS 119925 TaxID=1340428 RepID=A0A6A6VEQ8_9PLEO|nr:hypothetical protein M011DRAFT_500311 [Sporormia fimetaria CBS 119925]
MYQGAKATKCNANNRECERRSESPPQAARPSQGSAHRMDTIAMPSRFQPQAQGPLYSQPAPTGSVASSYANTAPSTYGYSMPATHPTYSSPQPSAYGSAHLQRTPSATPSQIGATHSAYSYNANPTYPSPQASVPGSTVAPSVTPSQAGTVHLGYAQSMHSAYSNSHQPGHGSSQSLQAGPSQPPQALTRANTASTASSAYSGWSLENIKSHMTVFTRESDRLAHYEAKAAVLEQCALVEAEKAFNARVRVDSIYSFQQDDRYKNHAQRPRGGGSFDDYNELHQLQGQLVYAQIRAAELRIRFMEKWPGVYNGEKDADGHMKQINALLDGARKALREARVDEFMFYRNASGQPMADHIF